MNRADKMIAINEEKKNASEIDLEALGKKIEVVAWLHFYLFIKLLI